MAKACDKAAKELLIRMKKEKNRQKKEQLKVPAELKFQDAAALKALHKKMILQTRLKKLGGGTEEDDEARDREMAVTRMSREMALPPIVESPTKEHKRKADYKTQM